MDIRAIWMQWSSSTNCTIAISTGCCRNSDWYYPSWGCIMVPIIFPPPPFLHSPSCHWDVSPETTAASSLSPSTSPVAFPPASSTSAPQVPTSPSPPPHTLSPPVVVDETDSPGSDSNSVAIIIGVVAAVILLITLILIVAILTVVCFRLRSKSLQEEAELRDNPAYGAAISTGPALEENPAYGAAISTGPALEENPAYGAAISTGPALEENPAYGAAISTWPGLEKNPAYGAFGIYSTSSELIWLLLTLLSSQKSNALSVSLHNC